MNLLLLAISFVLTGFNLVSMKALVQWGLGKYSFLFLLAYWVAAAVVSVIIIIASRRRAHSNDWSVGAIMGVMGAGGLIFMMLTLRHVSGVIAFPVRSCANMILTAVLAYAIWREDVSIVQWMGIACAVVAIYLLV